MDPIAPSGAVLADKDIRDLVTEQGLISEFVEGSLQGASYDLRLGPEYFTRGEHCRLSGESPGCRLAPGQFVLFTSLEHLKLPANVVGHAGLISRWAQRGLVSLFSPQIDPGFEGLIVVPLFNAGNAPVTVKLGEAIFTVEFVRTTCLARPWSEDHAPLRAIPGAVEVDMARPDLADLEQRTNTLETALKELKASFDGYTTGTGERLAQSSSNAGWWAVALAVVALAIAAAGLLVTLL